MEKIIYPVWKRADQSDIDFQHALHKNLLPQLQALPQLHQSKLCVVDQHVAPAESYRISNMFQPAFDAVLLLWIDAATQRQAIEDLLQESCQGFYCYLVTEAEQIPPENSKYQPGDKTRGMNEIVFLQKPERLSYQEWLSIWQDSHTQIAIDTQATFGYRQNIVVRKLSAEGPTIDAIIEENFPDEAISSRDAFYDAVGDPEKKQQHEQTMIESVMRFIDFDKIDCIPMSEYIIKN